MPLADLYISAIPDKPIESVYPTERQNYIYSTKNEELQKQRYYVWKLLEYALKNSFGYSMENINFKFNKSGKWECDKCFFSLSHTKDIVAVALSEKVIGTDIESTERQVSPTLYNKILTEKETDEYLSLNEKDQKEFILKKWCQKESIFKIQSENVFNPKKIETDKNFKSDIFIKNNKTYYYCVSGENIENLKVFTDIVL